MARSRGAIFSLAHISDLHFGSVPCRKGYIGPNLTKTILGIFGAGATLRNPFLPMTYQPLAAVGLAKDLHRLSETAGLDAVIVTGDLATTGDAVDLKAARAFIDGDLLCVPALLTRMQIPSLGNLSCPLFLMPGNHDRYRSHACFPMSRDFENSEIFGDCWHLPHCKPGLGDPRSLVRINRLNKDGESLLLCRIDLSFIEQRDWPQTPYEYLGQGRVTRDVLDEIDRITLQASEKWGDDLPIIWAVHFPPVGDIDSSLQLIDRDHLLTKAAEHGVTYILAGHTHVTFECSVSVVNSEGATVNVRVLACGTSTGFEENIPQEYAIREISVLNGVITSVNSQVKSWHATRAAFV
jgi:predicted phosphodiesterase